MKNNKTPGNDRLSKEFYVTFFLELGQLLLDCLNTNFEVVSLSESQKLEIIKSRNKKDINVNLNDTNWIDLDNDAMKILGVYYSYNNTIVSESN